jgi:hypothetical protein
VRRAALTGLWCLLLVGCDPGATAPRHPPLAPPPPVVPEQLATRFRVQLGRPGSDEDAPGARWCWVDLARDGRGLRARAWRPGVAVRCVSADYTLAEQVRLELVRSPAQDEGVEHRPDATPDPAPEEPAPVEERWLIEARVAPARPDDPDARPTLRGTATIVRGQGAARRSWRSEVVGQAEEVDEDEAYARWTAAREARASARPAVRDTGADEDGE